MSRHSDDDNDDERPNSDAGENEDAAFSPSPPSVAGGGARATTASPGGESKNDGTTTTTAARRKSRITLADELDAHVAFLRHMLIVPEHVKSTFFGDQQQQTAAVNLFWSETTTTATHICCADNEWVAAPAAPRQPLMEAEATDLIRQRDALRACGLERVVRFPMARRVFDRLLLSSFSTSTKIREFDAPVFGNLLRDPEFREVLFAARPTSAAAAEFSERWLCVWIYLMRRVVNAGGSSQFTIQFGRRFRLREAALYAASQAREAQSAQFVLGLLHDAANDNTDAQTVLFEIDADNEINNENNNDNNNENNNENSSYNAEQQQEDAPTQLRDALVRLHKRISGASESEWFSATVVALVGQRNSNRQAQLVGAGTSLIDCLLDLIMRSVTIFDADEDVAAVAAPGGLSAAHVSAMSSGDSLVKSVSKAISRLCSSNDVTVKQRFAEHGQLHAALLKCCRKLVVSARAVMSRMPDAQLWRAAPAPPLQTQASAFRYLSKWIQRLATSAGDALRFVHNHELRRAFLEAASLCCRDADSVASFFKAITTICGVGDDSARLLLCFDQLHAPSMAASVISSWQSRHSRTAPFSPAAAAALVWPSAGGPDANRNETQNETTTTTATTTSEVVAPPPPPPPPSKITSDSLIRRIFVAAHQNGGFATSSEAAAESTIAALFALTCHADCRLHFGCDAVIFDLVATCGEVAARQVQQQQEARRGQPNAAPVQPLSAWRFVQCLHNLTRFSDDSLADLFSSEFSFRDDAAVAASGDRRLMNIATARALITRMQGSLDERVARAIAPNRVPVLLQTRERLRRAEGILRARRNVRRQQQQQQQQPAAGEGAAVGGVAAVVGGVEPFADGNDSDGGDSAAALSPAAPPLPPREPHDSGCCILQ